MSTALLTFSIGPVHAFISQARRVADLWAGSAVLSQLASFAVEALLRNGGTMIFPVVDAGKIPEALPNRFVARIPVAEAAKIASAVTSAVISEWGGMIDGALARLRPLGLDGAAEKSNALQAIQCAWSWVTETGDYHADSRHGAEQFAASRMYRPFSAVTAQGLKCAVCGERTALPDGNRRNVADAWQRAFDLAEHKGIGAFFRTGQGRLCLVCATKRLFPLLVGKRQVYESFPDFQPDDKRPYFAVVTMDGDRLGAALSGDGNAPGSLADIQRRLSSALTEFATGLRSTGSTDLNVALTRKGRKPQLVYAGGEDVIFIADPRDALDAAIAVRGLYADAMRNHQLSPEDHTLSAAVLFSHTRTPAGTVFREAERLLKQEAKERAGRDAVAISLNKGSGLPAEVVLKWDDRLLTDLKTITSDVASGGLSSRQTYMLAEEGRELLGVLDSKDWEPWLMSCLSGAEVRDVPAAASLLAPFFRARKIDALRIARFIAVETR
ncbi:MAG: type III-B CRISPR-associated protein Cas10/Cmr2 [Acidobacteriota bacterium]